MAKKNWKTALDGQFTEECRIVNLKYEYPGFTGSVQWAVISELSEEEIRAKYSEQIRPYEPFMHLGTEFGMIRQLYIRNEKKHEMREIRHGHIYGFDEQTEQLHPEIAEDTLVERFMAKEESEALQKAMGQLSDIQRQRVYKRYFLGMGSREIAREEGVQHHAVCKSIEAALKNLKKFL